MESEDIASYDKFITETNILEKEFTEIIKQSELDKENRVYKEFTEYMLNEIKPYTIKIAELKDKLTIVEIQICKDFIKEINAYNKVNINYIHIEDLKRKFIIYIKNIDLIYKKYNI